FQKEKIKSSNEKTSYEKGIINWKTYYSTKIYENLIGKLYAGEIKFDKNELSTLKNNNKQLYKAFIDRRYEVFSGKRKNLKNIMKDLARKIYSQFREHNKTPKVGEINLGHLNQTTPFSTQFGYDRG